MQVCPSLLIKKDRGRPTDPKAKPKAFGETNVASNVPDLELLQHDDDGGGGSDDGEDSNEYGLGSSSEDDKELSAVKEDVDNNDSGGGGGSSDDEDNDGVNDALDIETESENDEVSEDIDGDDNDGNSIKNDGDMSDEEDVDADSDSDDVDVDDEMEEEDNDNETGGKESKAQKRKYSDIDQQLNAADTSLRALKRLAAGKREPELPGTTDDILSNEDFQRIKELKVYWSFIAEPN